MIRTSGFWKSSALLLFVILLPGAAAQGSHGLSDHHAFMAGLSEVPADDFVYFQINHTYFKWATVWYSARVREGSTILAFMADEENFAHFKADEAFEPIQDTVDGPDVETSGLASTLPSGLYFLIFANEGSQQALVKWEIFLEPRFGGDPGALRGGEPSIDPALLVVIVSAGSAAAFAMAAFYFLYRRR
ncbi:MAG: hypothetical protein LN413_01250 [Candidatus Thermoplasmatota archaeon]|nr:hypothetical protein [Candidatus Thermoplasmatota archaeon]